MQSKPIYNRLLTGLFLGLLMPFIVLLFFYLAKHPSADFNEYISIITRMNIVSPILSLCAVPNLILFYLFINKKWWYSARGLIFATLIWAILVFVTKFAI